MTSPKLHIVSSDSAGKTDCTVSRQLLDFLPNLVGSIEEADMVIVPIAYMPDYNFNPALRDIPQHKICLLNFLEMGWSAGDKANILGQGNLAQFGHLNTQGYADLDKWVNECPPRLEFMRELFMRDKTLVRLPIEWLCYIEPKTPHSPMQYSERAFEVFNCWGLSNPMRPRLHGAIFIGSQQYGYHVIDAWNQDQRLEKRNWVTLHVPWFTRQSKEEVMRWQRRAKISVSLFGAGRKSFRDAESPVDCLMARPDDGLSWSFPWTDENSIVLRGNIFEDLEAATHLPDLHDRYLAGLDNADKYRSRRYVSEYIMPAIEAAL